MTAGQVSMSSGPDLGEHAQAVFQARTDPRVGVDFPVRIFSGDFSGPLAGTARDLSVGGICVATASRFSFKSIRSVCLDIPDCPPLELKAEGCWQTNTTSDASMLTGVRFPNPEKAEIARLWNLVNAAREALGLFLFDRSELTDLSAEDAANLADCSRYRVVPPRRRIYRQAERCSLDDSIFLLVRGEVSLMARIGERPEVVLERLSPGRLLGGLPAVADLANQESAVADVQTTLLEISQKSFATLRLAKPLLAQRLAQVVTRTQLRLSQKLVSLASGAS